MQTQATGESYTGKTPTGTEYTATYVEDTALRFRCEVPAKGVSFVAHYDERQDALMSIDRVKGFGKKVGLKLDANAREWVKPFVDAEKARERERKDKIRREIEQEEQKKLAPFIARAREIGERVQIRRYTTGCNDRHEECSTDIVVEWAMPDGTVSKSRTHTW